MDYIALAQKIQSGLAEAPNAQAAMDLAVSELESRIPHYDWVGIYRLEGETLVLGPYRGDPSPHTRIPIGKGICGAAAAARETIVVPDVNADSRYLACSVRTKSELVVPIMDGDICLGEIDIDSWTPDAFADADRKLVENIARTLAGVLNSAV